MTTTATRLAGPHGTWVPRTHLHPFTCDGRMHVYPNGICQMNTRFCKRAELLHIADYDLPRFKSLILRKQLPHPKLQTEAEGYPAILAVVLVVGDLLVRETSITRDEFGRFGERELVTMVEGLRKANRGEGDWMGVRKLAGTYQLDFGKSAKVFEHLADDRATAISLIKVGPAFRAMVERANEVRPGILDIGG